MEILLNKFWQLAVLWCYSWHDSSVCDKDTLFIMWLEEVNLSCSYTNETVWSLEAQQNLNVCLKTLQSTCCPSSLVSPFSPLFPFYQFLTSYCFRLTLLHLLTHSHVLLLHSVILCNIVIMYASNTAPTPPPPSPSPSLTLLSSLPVLLHLRTHYHLFHSSFYIKPHFTILSLWNIGPGYVFSFHSHFSFHTPTSLAPPPPRIFYPLITS